MGAVVTCAHGGMAIPTVPSPDCSRLGNADRDHRGALCDRRLRLRASGRQRPVRHRAVDRRLRCSVPSNGQPVAILSGVVDLRAHRNADASGLRADPGDCHLKLTSRQRRMLAAARTDIDERQLSVPVRRPRPHLIRGDRSAAPDWSSRCCSPRPASASTCPTSAAACCSCRSRPTAWRWRRPRSSPCRARCRSG